MSRIIVIVEVPDHLDRARNDPEDLVEEALAYAEEEDHDVVPTLLAAEWLQSPGKTRAEIVRSLFDRAGG